MDEQLLSGLKVIELSQGIAGPYCAKLLASLGTQVAKVEPPQGDFTRRSGPFPKDVPHREKSALFLYLNTGKKGLTLNLKMAAALDIFHRLLEEADVLVESLLPKEAAELRMGYSGLEIKYPRLVVTSITPFGQTGPYRNHKVHEINLYAAGGLMFITGDPDREPLKMGPSLSQYQAGQNAAVATLGALWQRETTGRGQQVDVSIAECNATNLENAIGTYTYADHVVTRMGNRGYGRAAHGIYPCRDGYVGIIAQPEHRWSAMADLMEREELRDPQLGTRQGRQEQADLLDALMLPWLLEHDKEEIFKKGQELGLAFALVETPEDLLRCEQLEARRYFVEIDHQEAQRLRYPGPPFRISENPLSFCPAPLLGQHNEEVYSGILGFSREDLVLLRQSGAI